MGEKRQRITVRSESPVDFAAEARYQLEEIAQLAPSDECHDYNSTSTFCLHVHNSVYYHSQSLHITLDWSSTGTRHNASSSWYFMSTIN
jgi:hypothetical protein